MVLQTDLGIKIVTDGWDGAGVGQVAAVFA